MKQWLVVLDLDRTLTKDEAMADTLDKACQAADIEVNSLRKAQARVEAAAESFFPLEFLNTRYPREKVERLKHHFLEQARISDLVYPDTMPLLRVLEERSLPFLILTYGEHDWQALKLAAVGLDTYPHLITDVKSKGMLIRQWRHGGGYSPLADAAEMQAKRVLLVDDKASSFSDLPAGCRGAWLQRSDEPMLSTQLGGVPFSVDIVTDLLGCLDLL